MQRSNMNRKYTQKYRQQLKKSLNTLNLKYKIAFFYLKRLHNRIVYRSLAGFWGNSNVVSDMERETEYK